MTEDELKAYPGGDLVWKGLRDAAAGEETQEALLIWIGAPRLRQLGFSIPADPRGTSGSPEHRLYLRLLVEHGDDSHSQYNALLGRLASFEDTRECVG
jgi:hypothetical protein